VLEPREDGEGVEAVETDAQRSAECEVEASSLAPGGKSEVTHPTSALRARGDWAVTEETTEALLPAGVKADGVAEEAAAAGGGGQVAQRQVGEDQRPETGWQPVDVALCHAQVADAHRLAVQFAFGVAGNREVQRMRNHRVGLSCKCGRGRG